MHRSSSRSRVGRPAALAVAALLAIMTSTVSPAFAATPPPADPAVTSGPSAGGPDDGARPASAALVETEASDAPAADSSAIAARYVVSGRVTDDTGAVTSLANLGLTASDGSVSYAAGADSDGNFRFDGVSSGTYSLRVDAAGLPIFTRTGIVVDGDLELLPVLPRFAHVSGRVTNVPEGRTSLQLLREDDLAANATAQVNDDGTFETEVPPGRYLALVRSLPWKDAFAPTFAPGVTDPHDAAIVDLRSGEQTTLADFSPIMGHSISGTVTMPPAVHDFRANAQPRPILWRGRSLSPVWHHLGSGVDATGGFVIHGAVDDDYVVSVDALGPNDGSYWYDDSYYEGFYDSAVTAETATPVLMRGADVDGIDVTLVPFGFLRGTVRTVDGAPVADTVVTGYRWNGTQWQRIASKTTRGSYDLQLYSGSDWTGRSNAGLPAGTYIVEFSGGASDDPYCPQFWDGRATREAADPIEVTLGRLSGWFDARLHRQAAGCPTTGTLMPVTPIISGTPRVGDTLSVETGTWSPALVELTYQWLADGVPISGATGATYTLAGAQLGTRVSVSITGSHPGYADATVTSAPTGVVAAGTITAGAVTVSGTPRVGVALTVDPGSWTPSDVTLSYLWDLNGEQVEGVDGPTFVPDATAVGKKASVTVRGTKLGYDSVDVTLNGTEPIAPATSQPGTPSASPSPSPSGGPSASPTGAPSPTAPASPSPSADPSPTPTTGGGPSPSSAPGTDPRPDARSGGSLPATGVDGPFPLWAFGAVLLAIGAAMRVTRRNRAAGESRTGKG